jgi:hypothetical protein
MPDGSIRLPLDFFRLPLHRFRSAKTQESPMQH